MEYQETYNNILKAIDGQPHTLQPYSDAISLLVMWDMEVKRSEPMHCVAYGRVEQLRHALSANMQKAAKYGNYEEAESYRQLLYKSYLLTSIACFEDFLIAVEFDRAPQEKFYPPRQIVLKQAVNALQDLADDKLDELFLSMPPRVGKSTLLMFYELWLIGRDSEKHNLYCSYTESVVKAFYNGVLEVIGDPYTYHWQDCFPDSHFQASNADEKTINVNRKKRYKSLTCRSIDGSLNGACDADGTIIADDLVGTLEEAMSKDRLIAKWGAVDNNMLPRAKEYCKLLWCGTRWSVSDPMGIREELLTNDNKFRGRRFKVIDMPALDEHDESNFDYLYGVGFSTDYYQQRRASFERNNDMASWLAMYMAQPIERAGTVFDSEDLRMYNGVLPDEDPDRVYMAVDPAWGGGDFTASPVCVQYGDDIYIKDVVYTDEDKTISQPLLAQAAKANTAATIRLEANKMTEDYKKGVEDELKRIGYHCTIVTKAAPNGKAKEQRIFDKAPDIREHFIFLEDGKRSKAYSLFMQNVYSFKITGHNKHDDAPDSLSMAADMAFHAEARAARAFKRMF